MAGNNGDVGGLQLDPDVLADLRQDAVTNQAALSDKQKRDRARTSLRIDCPRWLKNQVAADAAQAEISISQWARFLLLWAVVRCHRQDPVLQQEITQARYEIRSLNAHYGLDLAGLEETLSEIVANSADTPFCTG